MKTKNRNILMAAAALLSSAILFPSCNQEEKRQLQEQANNLELKLHERDSAFNSIMNVMADVENEISKIKSQENILEQSSDGDFTASTKQQMVGDLEKINELIIHTNEKVTSLAAQLDDSKLELNAFKKRLKDMITNLKEREASIALLKENIVARDIMISELNTEVKTLVKTVSVQEEKIETTTTQLKEKSEALSTAYFAMNNEKALREKGLVTKEGGFLWLGKTTELQEDAAIEKFTTVDIYNTRRFYIDSEKLEIITEHPSASYKLVSDSGKVKYLEVTDPNTFWKISKYLVISIKG
ncbi:MAG: hypothetical protein ACI83W_002274 [Marinoscillum sp.]|jgi:hypothetical protein